MSYRHIHIQGRRPRNRSLGGVVGVLSIGLRPSRNVPNPAGRPSIYFMVMRLHFFRLLPLFFFSFFPFIANAATLYLDPSSGNYGPGDTFIVSVRLQTDSECVNAAH